MASFITLEQAKQNTLLACELKVAKDLLAINKIDFDKFMNFINGTIFERSQNGHNNTNPIRIPDYIKCCHVSLRTIVSEAFKGFTVTISKQYHEHNSLNFLVISWE